MLPNLAARLFTLTGDLVCVTAPDGYFLLLNPAFESSLGYTRLELLTEPFLALVPEEDRTLVRQATGKLAAGQGEVDFDVRLRTKQGDYSVPAGKYGVAEDELLRVDCATARPSGIAKKE